jgi:predicted nucleic acid-binding protein
MRIVVSDSSCLIDLRKASLLDTFLRLPFEFLIPNTLFEEELLKFTAAQKKALIRGGLKVIDLPGERVLRVQEVVRKMPALSVQDGFAFALAESHPGCILLTGDGHLRTLAAKHLIEVHGVLWVLDEIHRHEVTTPAILLSALRLFAADPTVRLPGRDVAAYLNRYEILVQQAQKR